MTPPVYSVLQQQASGSQKEKLPFLPFQSESGSSRAPSTGLVLLLLASLSFNVILIYQQIRTHSESTYETGISYYGRDSVSPHICNNDNANRTSQPGF